MSPGLQFGLKPEEIQKIQTVFASYPKVEQVLIYGSRALGTSKPNSDIDLTIVSSELSLSELLKIENDLDDLLLPYKFDLSLFSSLDNSNLVEHIQRIGKDFYHPQK